nr:LicD family protein [Veillonella denticariosi]
MSQYDFNTSAECTELIGSLKGMKLRHPQEDFSSVVYKNFEGHQIPVMKGYERYLRLIWGGLYAITSGGTTRGKT